MTKAGAIDRNHPKSLRQPIKDPANREILDHRAVAMQQDERGPFASYEIVQTHTVDIEKAADRWMVPLGLPRPPSVEESRAESGRRRPRRPPEGCRRSHCLRPEFAIHTASQH
jgi:hypothetical protein